MSQIYYGVSRLFGYNRGVLGKVIIDIARQNKIYEIILLAIWGTVVISVFQFKNNSGNK